MEEPDDLLLRSLRVPVLLIGCHLQEEGIVFFTTFPEASDKFKDAFLTIESRELSEQLCPIHEGLR